MIIFAVFWWTYHLAMDKWDMRLRFNVRTNKFLGRVGSSSPLLPKLLPMSMAHFCSERPIRFHGSLIRLHSGRGQRNERWCQLASFLAENYVPQAVCQHQLMKFHTLRLQGYIWDSGRDDFQCVTLLIYLIIYLSIYLPNRCGDIRSLICFDAENIVFILNAGKFAQNFLHSLTAVL